jgi:uncharacterized protein (TIGR02391 family)
MTDEPRTPVFPTPLTEAVAEVLGQTEYPGLSTSKLEALLPAAKLTELDPGPNKRTRLLTTLNNAQLRRGSGATLAAFINAAMSPVRYERDPMRWEQLRGELNAKLVFFGYRVNDRGEMVRGAQASTLHEAARLAGELMTDLRRRGCHDVLLTYCSEELLRPSVFHAVSEAAKSIPDRLRRHTGLGLDGEELYTRVFGTKDGDPRVRINALRTESEKSEHRGFKNLLTGIHGHYRNPRAHDTRLGSQEGRQDFLDAFALFSYVHRRLDDAGVVR